MLRIRLLSSLALLASFVWLFHATQTASVPPPQATAKPVNFNRDIRPLLSDNCFKCHGPNAQQRMANLRLDDAEGWFADRGGYRIIVPGHADQSKLYQKISSTDDSFRMPPTNSGRTLDPKQIELIKEWINQGAKWEMLWSFVAPKRPPLAEVKDKAWPRNPIDNFVLARLESEGLKPSPPADKATLLRRLYFDLTGLPPTPAEIDAFIADRSPNAYEKRVDQLLASPHYGERMAMPWLDLARYADTHGYHIDPLRNMSPWRDWVIKAFNENMPYDEFTIEQIAGDLLPHATLDQKIASGFNRNHMINFEGGAIPAEYQVEYVVDRVSTTSTAFLGLTMGCARCHDHKFDPISQKDFYRFYAFFNTVPERGLDGYTGNAVPVLPLPSHAQEQQLDGLKSQIAGTLAALPEKDILAERNAWQKSALASIPEPSPEGLTAYYPFDGNLTDASGSHYEGKIVHGDVYYDYGSIDKAVDFTGGQTQVSFVGPGDFERSKPFSLAVWIRPSSVHAIEVLQKREAGAAWRGWEVSADDSTFSGRHNRLEHIQVRLAHRWPDDAIEIQTRDRLEVNDVHHLAVVYDGSGKASGLKLYVDGTPVEKEVLKDHLTGDFRTSAPLEIGDRNLGTPFEGRLDDLRIYNRPLSDSEVEDVAIRFPARKLLVAIDGRPAKEIAALEPEKPAGDVQIGEEDKAATQQQKDKALEQNRQTRVTVYFLKYAAPKKNANSIPNSPGCARKRSSWKLPSPPR